MSTIKLTEFAKTEIDKASVVAKYLWDKNWTERNAGNLSIDFTDANLDIPSDLKEFRYIENSEIPKDAIGLTVFITGAGEKLRDLSNPEKCSCVLKVYEGGYYILWGGQANDFKATSELIPHLQIHITNRNANNRNKAIMHVHPIELIALSHHPVYGSDSELFNRTLWSMLPEVRLFVPRGIKLLRYALPGSKKLAKETAEALLENDVVVWAKHGVTVAGADIQEAFDFIDVANKGASILLKCLSCGFVPEGMTDDNLRELETTFDL